MKQMSSTNARKEISRVIDHVKTTGEPFVVSRQGHPEVLIMKIPNQYNSQLSESTNIAAYSTSFDFLENEPDIYSISDVS